MSTSSPAATTDRPDGDCFPDAAALERFVDEQLPDPGAAADGICGVIGTADYAKAVSILENTLVTHPTRLVKLAAHTKLLHRLVDLAGRPWHDDAGRSLSLASAVLRAQPDTMRSECLRDELAGRLADAADRMLTGGRGSADSPARRALAELTALVIGSDRCGTDSVLELSHCLLHGTVLQAPDPKVQPQRRPPQPPVSQELPQPPVSQEPLLPATSLPVSYADLAGGRAAAAVLSTDSDSRLVLDAGVSLSVPLRAGDRLPLGRSARLALLNPRQTADELLIGDLAPQLMSLLNRCGGHLLLGVSAASCAIEGVQMLPEQRDRLVLGLHHVLAASLPVPDAGRVSIQFHPVTGRSLPVRNGGPANVVQVSIQSGRPVHLHSYQGRFYTRSVTGAVRLLAEPNDVLAEDARLLALRSSAAHEARRLRAECRRLRAQLKDLGCVFLPPEQ